MAHLQAAGEPAAERAGERDRQQAPVVLDAVSRHLIDQLQHDGRRSYAAIGKAVGLSEAAVRQRVQRLIDVGAMQIVAVTDPMSLGRPGRPVVHLKVITQSSVFSWWCT